MAIYVKVQKQEHIESFYTKLVEDLKILIESEIRKDAYWLADDLLGMTIAIDLHAYNNDSYFMDEPEKEELLKRLQAELAKDEQKERENNA